MMDNLLNSIGQFGRYQKLVMLLIGTVSILRAMVTYSSVFIAAKPKFTCHNENSTFHDNCQAFSNTTSYKCEFDQKYYKSTIVTEWALICDKIFYVGLIQTIFMIGSFASLFAGFLSDKYGRKRLLMIASSILSTVFIINAVLQMKQLNLDDSARYVILSVTQFFSGICSFVMYTSSYVLLIELTSSKYSTTVTNFNLYMFVLGEVIVLVIAYLSRDWRVLNWSITAFTVLVLILVIFLIPESPRFLISKKQISKSFKVLNKIARVNGNAEIKSDVELNDILSDTRNDQGKKNSNGFIYYLRNPIQNLIMTLLLSYIWTALALIYYGVGLGITSLGSLDPYLIYFLSSVAELIGYFSGNLNERFDRKKMFIFYLSLASLMCLGVAVVPENKSGSSLKWNSILTSVFALVGKAAASGAFNSAYVYTSLLYPTEVRNTFVLFVSSFGKMGSIVSPQINLLRTLVWAPLPYIVFSSASFLACLFVFLLPNPKSLR